MKKIIIIIILIVISIVFLVWLFMESSKPLPGEKVTDLGRGHVPMGENVEYNSNPPTSGKHYEEWIRSGIYTEVKDDRNLVHSLEHGYIVMSYICTSFVIASEQSERGDLTEKEIATDSSDPRNDEECNDRKEQLSQVYEKKGQRKLIVVPRENLDSNFALTAWNYLDKFDEFDSGRIDKFIDSHRDQGPEKTME